jgi:hypothetical protein
MDTILRDVRVGLRALRRAPISTAVVVISLALGVGANTAIYSLAHATLLRPLDLPALDRLFVLSKVVDAGPNPSRRTMRCGSSPRSETARLCRPSAGSPPRPPSSDGRNGSASGPPHRHSWT